MSARRGLLLDYGGVLTSPVGASFRAWEEACGLEPGRVLELILAAYDDADGGLVGRLERGELSASEFDLEVTALLARDGERLPEGSVLEGLFAGMRPDGRLWDLVARARGAGVRTGLLSNSWGTGLYPHARLEATFDTLVISGEVGLRKPDPAIFELACERLDLPPHACVFVDDLRHNVEVARTLGMHAVLHTGDDDATAREVAAALDL